MITDPNQLTKYCYKLNYSSHEKESPMSQAMYLAVSRAHFHFIICYGVRLLSRIDFSWLECWSYI